MIEKKIEKVRSEPKGRDEGVELENQFILRLPEEPARAVREALQTGSLKDRITIKMDSDLRYGEVRFDDWLLHAKIMDLPTIVECLKTIDNKSFYKSSDICQIVICKEEPDALDTEKESPNKSKKKDPNKVDKKYLWPHGITPPCKNIRKRRFRKTLKKKNVEAPEIEKEVKRLLRIDNDAVKVDFEIISEDVDKPSSDQNSKDYNDGDEDFNEDTMNDVDKTLSASSPQKDINVESDDEDDIPRGSTAIGGVGEHDIFGEELSSSDDNDDDERNNTTHMRDLEDTSRLSADDSRISDYSMSNTGASNSRPGINTTKDSINEFNESMFDSHKTERDDGNSKFGGSSSNLAAPGGYFEHHKRGDYEEDDSNESPQLTVDQINAKISELRRQYDDLRVQQAQKAQEISSIQNPTLKQRMQETLDNLLSQMIEKELEIKDYENML